jgi:hypothetical protein
MGRGRWHAGDRHGSEGRNDMTQPRDEEGRYAALSPAQAQRASLTAFLADVFEKQAAALKEQQEKQEASEEDVNKARAEFLSSMFFSEEEEE